MLAPLPGQNISPGAGSTQSGRAAVTLMITGGAAPDPPTNRPAPRSPGPPPFPSLSAPRPSFSSLTSNSEQKDKGEKGWGVCVCLCVSGGGGAGIEWSQIDSCLHGGGAWI